MPENMKEYWGIVVAAATFLVGYGDMRRRVGNTEKKIGEHMEDHKGSSFITMPQHDRLQRQCQELWKSEFAHIKDALDEMKQDIKELRQSK